jgi:hypothetical protein
MMGRRMAAMLCVLLVHALFLRALQLEMQPDAGIPPRVAEAPALILIDPVRDPAIDAFREPTEPELTQPVVPPPQATIETEAVPATTPPAALTQDSMVDWPVEARKSAARVLEQEREAERIARMFAGPQGTWASLTKRQRDELNHFRWKPGVDGLERDEKGNTIYHINSRCVLVNFVFIGCSLGGKPPAYGDLFKDMRLYFDEQRRPATTEGNGTEPESLRPPKWSKPLE